MKALKSKLLLGAVILTPIAVLSPQAAFAQDNEDSQSQSRYAIDEVVTTARRVEEGLQEAPIAVTALTGLELENRGALDVIDFADVAPNVSMKTDGNVSGFAAAPRTAIRGIGQADFVINTDPAVGLYADGVYLGRSIGSVLDLVDVERVEALRGPQGTLFGRNSTGGAINIISKKPDVGGEFDGYLTGAIGEGGYKQMRGAVNIPLEENAAIRFSALKRERDGFIPLLNPNPIYDDYELGREDVWGVKAAFRYEPSDNFTLDLDADFSARNDSAAPIVAVQLGDLSIGETSPLDPNRPRATSGASTSQMARRFNNETPVGPPLNNVAAFQAQDARCGTDQSFRDTSPLCLGNFYASSRDGSWATWFDDDGNEITADDQSLDAYGFSGRLNWDLGPVNIKTISAWRGFDSSFLNGSPAPVFVATNDNVSFFQDQMSHEITLSGRFADRVDWLAGAFYQEEDGQETVHARYPFTPPPTSRFGVRLPISNISERNIDNTSKAVYGQLSADITDRLELTLGGRYTDETKEVLVNQTTYSTFAAGSGAGRTEAEALQGQVAVFTAPARNAKNESFLANLSYDVTDDAMVYAQYSDGFRNGGFPARVPGGTPITLFESTSYDEEYVSSYELGAKTTLFDGNVRLNAAVFRMDYTDMQINATTFVEEFGSNVGTIVNVGESRIQGVELEGSYLATDNLRFDFTVGYLDSKLTGINPDDNGNAQFILNQGNNLQRTITEDSDITLPFAPEFQINLGANYSFFLGNGAEIRNRADVFYESKQFSNIGNYRNGIVPSTTKVNYNASYIPENGDWELTLGARNLLDEEFITNAALETTTRAGLYHVYGRGREAYVQLKVNFGE